uniref:Uncharacterized protein n=1 Tax=Sus scrofa TaxID=9823 RepID=A0A286ZRG3_PIG
MFCFDSFWSRIRMSVWNPPRLLDLAGKILLRDEASAITALEYLPAELFPPLFILAFYGASVALCPPTVQAVLDGLDVLFAQKVHPGRCRLQVLDLRNTGQNFWRMWAGFNAHVYSSSSMAPVDSSRTKHPLALLDVFLELCLKERTLDQFLIYLIRWMEKRNSYVHLCCKRLKIISICTWRLSILAMFAPLLGQMTNLQRLVLSHVHVSTCEEQEQHVLQFTSQFLRLHHLQDLYMESPFFLKGCLDQMFRCLKTPLDNLIITHCLLIESDLTHLSECLNISQLKGLDLSGIKLTNFNPQLLQVLLEKVVATLQELDLDECGIMDSHLEAILPALSHCFQLSSFSVCGNLLSMVITEKLLQYTAELPHLGQELYPAPQECYGAQGAFCPRRLTQLQAELLEIMRDLGQPRTIWISSSPCPYGPSRRENRPMVSDIGSMRMRKGEVIQQQ